MSWIVVDIIYIMYIYILHFIFLNSDLLNKLEFLQLLKAIKIVMDFHKTKQLAFAAS